MIQSRRTHRPGIAFAQRNQTMSLVTAKAMWVSALCLCRQAGLPACPGVEGSCARSASPTSPLGSDCTVCARRAWSQVCSAQRVNSKGGPTQCLQVPNRAGKKMEPDSSRWCLAKAREETGTSCSKINFSLICWENISSHFLQQHNPLSKITTL